VSKDVLFSGPACDPPEPLPPCVGVLVGAGVLAGAGVLGGACGALGWSAGATGVAVVAGAGRAGVRTGGAGGALCTPTLVGGTVASAAGTGLASAGMPGSEPSRWLTTEPWERPAANAITNTTAATAATPTTVDASGRRRRLTGRSRLRAIGCVLMSTGT
jgi:hypothetical protein